MTERKPEYDTTEHAKASDTSPALERMIRQNIDLQAEKKRLEAENAKLRQMLDNALVGAKANDV